MSTEFEKPYGWTVQESPSYDFGEAKFGKSVNDIPANPTGDQGGEKDSHSQCVDPDGEYGAAKVQPGLGRYVETDESKLYKPESSEKDPAHTGSLDLPLGHTVIEDGVQQNKNYYLVVDIKSEKFYTVIPEFKEGQTYKSPMRDNRTEALNDAYRLLSASLPDDALAQLRQRFPETPAL